MTTLTAADAGTELLAELRALTGRDPRTLEELRELADELTGILRRARGRITRLARQAEPEPAVKPEPAPAVPQPKAAEPEPPRPQPVAETAAPVRTNETAPDPGGPRAVRAGAVEGSRDAVPARQPAAPLKGEPGASGPTATVAAGNDEHPASGRPAPRRISTAHYLPAALAVVCTTVRAASTRTLRRAVSGLGRCVTALGLRTRHRPAPGSHWPQSPADPHLPSKGDL